MTETFYSILEIENYSKKKNIKEISIENINENLPKNIFDKFIKLKILICEDNNFTELPNLPDSLTELYCDNNQLTVLPSLPKKLNNLHCNKNKLIVLPDLPDSLQNLYCSNNRLTSLPNLPQKLEDLNCNNNQLTTLPDLPNKLLVLSFSYNNLKTIPILPKKIMAITCNNNNYSQDYINNILENKFRFSNSNEVKNLIIRQKELTDKIQKQPTPKQPTPKQPTPKQLTPKYNIPSQNSIEYDTNKRCPNGFKRNKITKKCEKKSKIMNPQSPKQSTPKQSTPKFTITSLNSIEYDINKRCPNGRKRNKKTRKCEKKV